MLSHFESEDSSARYRMWAHKARWTQNEKQCSGNERGPMNVSANINMATTAFELPGYRVVKNLGRCAG